MLFPRYEIVAAAKETCLCIALSSEEERATAAGNVYRNAHSDVDFVICRQIHRRTDTDHNASHLY